MNRNYVQNTENGRNSIGKKNLQCAFFGSIDCLTRRYHQYDRDRCLANPISTKIVILQELCEFWRSSQLCLHFIHRPSCFNLFHARTERHLLVDLFFNFSSYLFYKKFLAVFTNADIGVKNWIECRSFKLSCHNFIIPFENTPPCQKKCKLVWC